MATKVVLAVTVFCAVCVNSDDFYGRSIRMPEYVRIKRARYYSSPPMKFYRRPPISYPVKGIFSYTPPPNYMAHDDPYPGNFRPKVSKRPTNAGLEEEDLSNIVKHLSKQDLDKIIDFASEKYRDPPFEKYRPSLNKFPTEGNDVSGFKSSERELNSDQKFLLNGPYVNNYDIEYADNNKPPVINGFKPMTEADDFQIKGPLAIYQDTNDRFKNVQKVPQQLYNNPPSFQASPQDLTDVPLHVEETMDNNQFSFANAYIQQELYGAASEKASVTFTDSKTLKEEQLPKPVNLRQEQDYEVANTHNVPTAVKAHSYKVESFGDLPLMDYSSKLDLVSSYHVPHYSVVSPSARPPSPPSLPQGPPPSYGSPSSPSQLVSSPAAAAIKVPKLEPAPPISAAKEQSDAHLKATKIWTHRSRGTAYTLHDDGTLSLEKPRAPKPVYGQ